MTTNARSLATNDWLHSASQQLEQSGISTARLDCLVLLTDVVKKNKSFILAHPEFPLSFLQVKQLGKKIERRKNHEPLAYIRGKSEFYGREFIVNKHTLQPRPETETMLDLFSKIYKSQKLPSVEDSLATERGNVILGVVDVGTGSGAIGISIKLELPEVEVLATDISNNCLTVAKQNSGFMNADIKFYQGDLLEPIYGVKNFLPNAILANLPYVPDGHTINQAAMQEPELAIFGGHDGLNLYRRLFAQISEYKLNAKYVFTESLPFQHEELAKIAKAHGFRLEKTDDFIQVFSR